MRHPFDGIITPQSQTRRSWLSRALAALGGLFLGARAFAAAPPSTKVVVEPEPNPEPKPKPTDPKGEAGKLLTRALNENGAVTKALNENGRLTRALNENGNMTQALRENGGGLTTLALGEEGGNKK